MHVGFKSTTSIPNAVCGVRLEGKVRLTELAGFGIQFPIWISTGCSRAALPWSDSTVIKQGGRESSQLL